MGKHKNDQEEFWAGEFGNNYATRNVGDGIVAANLSLFSKVLDSRSNIRSVIEFGANVGLNLMALKALLPLAEFAGIEINSEAVTKLRKLGFVDVIHQSIIEYSPVSKYDFVLSKTVLIHIAPENLPTVYDNLYASTSRYVCIAEYYNPAPVEVTYHGHKGKLFKRDFAGEILARFPDLSLVAYGFAYRYDTVFPQDDITWFLLEKKIV